MAFDPALFQAAATIVGAQLQARATLGAISQAEAVAKLQGKPGLEDQVVEMYWSMRSAAQKIEAKLQAEQQAEETAQKTQKRSSFLLTEDPHQP